MTQQLIGWDNINRKYISGLILTVIATIVLIADLIALVIIPGDIIYHYSVLVYNGPFIRLCVGITMGGIVGLLLLIGLPLLIINTLKKKKLQN